VKLGGPRAGRNNADKKGKDQGKNKGDGTP
jgi:hypothetical protein